MADRVSTDIAALFICAWAMFFDGSACDDGCGVGILLVSPQGVTYSFSIRMTAPCTNNLVEYEAVRREMELLLEVDLGILQAGSGSGRAKKSPVFFLTARARPDPVAGP